MGDSGRTAPAYAGLCSMSCKVVRLGRRHSRSPFRAITHAAGQLDVVGDQIAEHAVDRTVPAEDVEDQTNGRLNLFVGIQHYFTRRAADVSAGQQADDLTALCL